MKRLFLCTLESIEDEIIEALCTEASSGGTNPARIRKRHSVMNEVTGKYSWGLLSNTGRVRGGRCRSGRGYSGA